ncbi:LOW QUALITY PROTEIN: hypothetical protein BSKO_03418 [Bryopsis sp. KO-2023]|nr:LOW QUALITY PROTEIN: hypothetical protein BSKO_03418 [Bryopsis sp. KO-2023]
MVPAQNSHVAIRVRPPLACQAEMTQKMRGGTTANFTNAVNNVEVPTGQNEGQNEEEVGAEAGSSQSIIREDIIERRAQTGEENALEENALEQNGEGNIVQLHGDGSGSNTQDPTVKSDVSMDAPEPLYDGESIGAQNDMKSIPSGNQEVPQNFDVPKENIQIEEDFHKNLEGVQAVDSPGGEGRCSVVTTPTRTPKSNDMICSPRFDYSLGDSPPDAAPNSTGCAAAKQFQCYALSSLMPPPGHTSSFDSFAKPARPTPPAPELPPPSQRDAQPTPRPPPLPSNSANAAPPLHKTSWTSAQQNIPLVKTELRMPPGGVHFLSAGGKNLALSEKQMSQAAALFADINDDTNDGLQKGNLRKRRREGQNAGSHHEPNAGVLKAMEINGPSVKIEVKPFRKRDDPVRPSQGAHGEGVENQGIGLFQMASGKKPRVSMEMTNRAQALMKDSEELDDGGRNPKGRRLSEPHKFPGHRMQQPLSDRPCNLPALMTGAGGPVRISNSKLMAAQSMLGLSSESSPAPNSDPTAGFGKQMPSAQAPESDKTKEKESTFSFPRLETGAGRQVDVSKSGIQRVKARLGLPASGTAAVDGKEGKADDVGKDPRSPLPQCSPCNQSVSRTPPPQSSPLSEFNVTPGSGRSPCTALAALSSLTPVLRPKLRLSMNKGRGFAKPRISLEGPIGAPTKRQGKSRRSWRPLVPSNIPDGFQPVQTLACVGPQQQRQALHDLYDGQSRCTIAEHFGKTPQAKSPLTMDPDTARNFVFSDGTSVEGLRGEMLKCGCDPEYASEEWCKNHFQWIIWKLASHDSINGGCSLMPAAVLDELKYRYEVEYGKGDRSVLHMMFEQDWTSSDPMILLVSRIIREATEGQFPSSHPTIKVELTDGWYPVIAKPDSLLTKLIESGCISVGDKLRVKGASLIASRPDEPLQAVKSSTLRLHYNGCHPVRWDEPLGIDRRGGASSIVSLGLAEPNGGPISRTLVCIVRRYPLMHWGKLPSGAGISRTPKSWERARKSFEERAAAVEAEVQEEIHRKVMLESSNAAAGGGLVEKVAHDMLKNGGSSDCGVELTMDQKQELSRCLEDRQARMHLMGKNLLQKKMEQRDIQKVQGSPYIRLMVSSVDLEKENMNKMSTNAIIKVWRPTEDSGSLQEGGVYDITNLNVTGKSNGTLELSTQPSTKWEFVADHNDLPEQLATKYYPRRRITLPGLINLPTKSLFDFEGCIVFVGNLIGDAGGWNFDQWVFLVDETISGDMDRLLAIKFSGCIESVDFLEHRTDRGAVCLFKDVEMKEVDAVNGLLVAHSTEFSSHELCRAKKRGGAGKLDQWMSSSKDLLDRFTARIEVLISKE